MSAQRSFQGTTASISTETLLPPGRFPVSLEGLGIGKGFLSLHFVSHSLERERG